MTRYREIIGLHSLNFSERNIALSCSVSRNTVSKVLKKANEMNISWPLDETMTDDALENILFPKEKSATVYTDQIEHTARRFSAWLPPIQCTLSGQQCMMIIQG